MVSTVDLNTVDGLSEQRRSLGLNKMATMNFPRLALAVFYPSLGKPLRSDLSLAGRRRDHLLDFRRTEALILLGFVFFITGISLYQEGKTEHALEALRDLSSPRALVIRDGQQKRIAGREVVREDILVLAEGDRVSADAMVLSCTNLSTDESLLTGESLPVRKVAATGYRGNGTSRGR